MKNKENNTIVVQSNYLIESKYTLTVYEQRLIFAMISMIKPTDEDFKEYKISLAELSEMMNIDLPNIYREAKKIIYRIMRRVLQIETNDGSFIQIHWISCAEHKKDYVNISFHPKLKPYLLQLKNCFTKCDLKLLNQFQSIYTIRIYQLLKQYKSIGYRTFLVDDLKKILGIEENKYKIFKDFRRRVLDQARNELDMRADITFDLDGIVKGKKTSKITFKILDKKSFITNEIQKTSENNIRKVAECAVKSPVNAAPPRPKVPPPKYWKQFREYAVKKNDIGLIQLIDLDEWDVPVLRYEYKEWEKKIYLK